MMRIRNTVYRSPCDDTYGIVYQKGVYYTYSTWSIKVLQSHFTTIFKRKTIAVDIEFF
jgi:hypothetical protein